MENIIKELESAYLIDVDKFVVYLHELYILDAKNFKKNILFQQFFLDVISLDFNTEHYVFLQTMAIKVMENTEGIFDDDFIKEIYLTIGVYMSLYTNLNSNTERLNKSEFIEKPLAIQLQTFLSYLQDQYTLSKRESYSPKKDYITGFDGYVASKETDIKGMGYKVKVSLSESMDTVVEIINLIIPYLYYKKREEVGTDIIPEGKISPYQDVGFEELIYLTQQRLVFTTLWEKYKYEDWTISIEKTLDKKEDVFYYLPSSEKLAIADFYGVNRLNYQLNSRALLFNSISSNQVKIKKAHRVMDELSKCNRIDLLKSISIEEYESIKIFVEHKIKIESSFLDNYYNNLSKKNVNLKLLLDFLEFMISISMVFDNMEYPTNGNDGDFSFLTPIIDKELLIDAFSRIKGYTATTSSKVIDVFTFGLSQNRGYDLFSKPLVNVARNKIIFTPYLFTHINVLKAVQEWIKQSNFNIAKKGFEFEERVANEIRKNKYLRVNSNVKFIASDGKDIEYDLIAKMGNTIIIIEFKNMFHPYSGKDHFKNFEIIKDGIEQLKRREQIYYNDFDTLREKLDFTIDKEYNLIKILCTNVYNYTPLMLDDIYITDVSTIGKFFNNPESHIGTFNSKTNTQFLIKYRTAWKNNTPELGDLITFLNEPESIKLYKDKVHSQFKPIYKTIDTDHTIAYLDYYFKENPYLPTNLPTNFKKPKQIIGRNELCNCGSQKKYKKCCGKA